MKPFALQSRMLTMRGVFYPTGYMFVMLPRLEDAERLDHDLQSSGYRGHDVMLVPPATILEQIGATVNVADGVKALAGRRERRPSPEGEQLRASLFGRNTLQGRA